MEDKKVSIIEYGKPFNGHDKEVWPEMITWLVEHIKKLETAFVPEIQPLRLALRAQFPKESAT